MPPRSTSAAAFPAVKVQFYRRMKPHRVYPVTVAWGERPKPLGSIKHVTIRLLGAGAQIVPSEQALDATRPDLKATFFVTPLATGWLRAQRIEVLIAGRKVQEIPLASRVVCQCWAAFWFIMAFVVAGLLIWLRSSDVNWNDFFHNNIPAMPDMVTQQAPAVGEYWDKVWQWKGEALTRFSEWNRERLLAFPAFLALIVLSLWMLFIHRDRRTSKWSNPIAVPPGVTEE